MKGSSLIKQTLLAIYFSLILSTNSKYIIINVQRTESFEIRWNQYEQMSVEKNDIPFSICDAAATNQYVNNLTVSVQPNPIVIKPGKQISLDIGVDLLKEIPIGSRVSLKLKKDDWIDIPMPCLKVPKAPIPVGSCTYEIQDLLNLLQNVIQDDCFKYFPGNGCKLPLMPGHYGTGGPLSIKLPKRIKIPKILKYFINGGIKVHDSITINNNEAICTNAEIYIHC